MFLRTSNKLPKPIEFSLKPEEFLEDIETIARSEDDRKMLYQCIDCKVPQTDSKLAKLNDILKDNEDLALASKDLTSKCDELNQQRKELEDYKQDITTLISKK